MRLQYELANFLVASWRIARPNERLPTSHGVLDRALEKVQAALPRCANFRRDADRALVPRTARYSTGRSRELPDVRTKPDLSNSGSQDQRCCRLGSTR